MYKGFNLKLEESFPSFNNLNEGFERTYEQGKIVNEENKKHIQSELEKFLRNDNKLDGNSIKDKWFPKVKADIFISHSHNDEKQAIALSGWLKRNFGLDSFIDSLVWDYAPDLIDKFNNTYNIIAQNPPNVTYGYKTAKYISSHLDLMLSTALNSMIDHCETLIFLNTPSSTGQAIKNDILNINNVEIESPWIYSELETSKIVREKIGRIRLKYIIKSFNSRNFIGMEALNESSLPPIVYDTDIKHLYNLTKNNLNEWNRLYKNRKNLIGNNQNALDTLYDLMRIQ